MQDLITKANTLLEALPYIQRFAGATFVVKYGGSFMDSRDEAVRTGVARDVVFLEAVEINPVVVHGGGKRINKALAAAGVESRFVNGLRYTDAATVEIVDRVLSTEINPEIVDLINSLGGVAKGFAGAEIFSCKKHAPNGEDYGFVGEVIGVNTAPLEECIANGITPVISPTARDADGQVYNCNADAAAAQAAIALTAKRLVFMSDVPGLLRDPKDDATLISHLDIAEVDALKKAGIIATGMIPKVDSAVTAINAGVDKVALVNGLIHHAVLLEIFTDKGVGTEIVK
ncbi:MAG TPA: acetylglutamate kinase [Verrucomicrobiales bacterium]|nr:acetylglutamate kinase [Verrucomicrobiales bacterium]